MADKEEIASVVVEVSADTAQFDREMAALAAKIGVQAQQINRALGGASAAPITQAFQAIPPAATAATAAVQQTFKTTQQAATGATAAVTATQAAIQALPAAANQAAAGVSAATRKMQKNFGFMASNMAAQFQDVGVQIAAGTNPMQIALQQGTQMALVFQSAAQAGQSMGAVLKSAFVSLLAPANLIPIAIIAAAAALYQFVAAGSDVETIEEKFKSFSATLREIEKSFGVATGTFDEFNQAGREFLQIQLASQLANQSKEIKKVTSDIQHTLGSFFSETAHTGFVVARSFQGFGELTDIAGDLAKAIDAGSVSTEEFTKRLVELESTDPKFLEKRLELMTFIEQIRKAQGLTEAYRKAQDAIANSEALKKQAADAKEYGTVLDKISKISPVDENDIDMFERLSTEIKKTASSAYEVVGAYEALNLARERLGASTQEAFDLGQIEGFTKKFEALLNVVEGMQTTPYFDVTGLAIGYGMHQLIDDAGKQHDIVEGMVIDQTKATVQLARQWRDIYSKEVMKAIGPEVWEKLDDNSKAAIASITWNFGRVPNVIAKAAETFDPEMIAKAFRSMKTGRPEDVVADRRRETEALAALGKTRVDQAKDEIKAAQDLKEKQDAYNLSLEHQIELRKLESKLTFETPEVRERELFIQKEIFKLLEDKVDITQEMMANIREEARLVGLAAQSDETAAIAKKKNAEAEKELREQTQLSTQQQKELERAVQKVSDSFEDAFVDAILNGKKLDEIIQSLIRSLAEMALRASISKIFSFGANALIGAIGGGLGGAATPALAAPASAAQIAGRSSASSAPVVQLHVVEGAMFEPRVARISGNVAVRTVSAAEPQLSRAAMAAGREQARAYG